MSIILNNTNSTDKLIISVPNIKLIRTINKIRIKSENYLIEDPNADSFNIYSFMMLSLMDITNQFDELNFVLGIGLDFATNLAKKKPEFVVPFVEKIMQIYRESDKQCKTKSIATRIEYSKLKMFLAQFRLEVLKDQNFADVRNLVYHSIPIIQELNFIVVLIKAKRYIKATMFLQDISMLFIMNRVDPRLILPFYELVCLSNLGAGPSYYATALDALEKGYKITQTLPELTIQSSRFITLFEKVIGNFKSPENKGETKVVQPENLDIDKLKVPGVIFDYIFLYEDNCADPEGILVEM
jgi:hypothetical protein